MKRAPALMFEHKTRSVRGATNYITWALGDWAKAVCSDEKKCTMDFLDRFGCNWADKRCRERIMKMRHSGGASTRVWGCLSGACVGQLAILDGTQKNSLK